MNNPQDPVTPHVTFDNYVIPETVTSSVRNRANVAPTGPQRFQINGMVIAVGAIGVLTFLLGVMVTLKVMGPREEIAVVLPQPALPVLATDETVTRQQAPDLMSTVPSVEPPVVPQLQAAVLQGLQPSRTVGKLTKDEMVEKAIEAQEMISRNKLRMLREGVLAGVYSVKASTGGGHRRLVLTTVNAEMTRQAMGNLLLKAAEDGEIAIPASLNTADGAIDMDTMLFNLIQTSLANDGTVEGMEAATEMSRRAFAASDAKTQEVRGSRVYVVEPGDSLAYISLQFYGRPGAYLRIFDANREQLRSPDLIQVGQRLIIPG